MRIGPLILSAVVLGSLSLQAQDAPEAERFEKKIRPLLVERCLKCHSAQAPKLKGGLRLDTRDSALKGGDTGPAIVPGSPEKSLLIQAVGYQNVDLQMPPKGKLTDAEIADLTDWIRRGAVWPRGEAAVEAPKRPLFNLTERKSSHWAWQPLSAPRAPAVWDRGWVKDPIDGFILSKLEARGLTPAPAADPRTLLRRVTFDLTGLPPTPAEVEAFVADPSLEKVVDRLLGSPRFGETWARHWLDLVRYAETRGHEYDYPMSNVWPYRDYVIRALNADVPYPRFVLEHIAGDRLPDPRVVDGVNESLLATGWWYFGEWLHSPVDLRADEMDRVANQIEVFGKTFLALGINCARCHDHKFDAISQRDYYALAGYLKSSCYRQARYDATGRDREAARELGSLRAAYEKSHPSRGQEAGRAVPRGGDLVVDFGEPGSLLQEGAAWSLLHPGDLLPEDDPARPMARVVDLAGAWFDPAWNALRLAPGTDSDPGAITWMQAGKTLRTPPFVLTRSTLYYLVRGAGSALAEIDGHRMIAGPLHRGSTLTWKDEGLRWVAQPLGDYRSPDPSKPQHRIRVEFTPASAPSAVLRVVQSDEAPEAPGAGARALEAVALGDDGRTWIEGRRAVQAKIAQGAHTAIAVDEAGGTDEFLLVRGASSQPSESVPRRFLEAFVGPNPPAPGVASGRLELALAMVDPKVTPVVPRVLVNRLWHHLMGRGIVPTVDDFGVMGQAPTHPELLDHLASSFVADGGSIKRMIRRIVLSNSYAMSGAQSPRAQNEDAANLLWHHRPVRRLPAEAVRDAMLAVSGRLSPRMYGPPVPIHLDGFQEGRGKPQSGPLDGDGRRSIYLSVRRNFLSSMLLAFDFPQPFTAMGRRSVSNVPAQSLILRNSPFVHDQARVWAGRLIRESGSPGERIARMIEEAYGRSATPEEVAEAAAFL
ncbi:MAG TPA: PSD1 and planctomycete cytochrome C domain-containing protein, partial [Planctomycetota bacterium]|nr:PSD1 and planctomycete cytochrome C domain-containing protein [Planctomycetota bacterium]